MTNMLAISSTLLLKLLLRVTPPPFWKTSSGEKLLIVSIFTFLKAFLPGTIKPRHYVVSHTDRKNGIILEGREESKGRTNGYFSEPVIHTDVVSSGVLANISCSIIAGRQKSTGHRVMMYNWCTQAYFLVKNTRGWLSRLCVSHRQHSDS